MKEYNHGMSVIPALHKNYVKGTLKDAIVQFVEVFVCHLTVAVVKGIGSSCNKVYINSRVLKHMYDKRPAVEYDFLVEHAVLIIKYPEQVYKNKGGKRGSFVFVKKIGNDKYMCSLETVEKESTTFCEVVTFFKITDSYLKTYELLWEWKGGTPSS